MKTRIFPILALALSLPVIAQANSQMSEQAFENHREMLNLQSTVASQTLQPTSRAHLNGAGHSAAANDALMRVADNTRRETNIMSGLGNLIAQGQSAAAGPSLKAVSTDSMSM